MGGGTIAFPQLDFTTYPSQVFWIAVTFLIMYVIMTNIVLPPIAKTIEKRRDKIASDIDKASEINKEIDKLKENYDFFINNARFVANREIIDTRKIIDDTISKAQSEYFEESEKRLAASEANIKETTLKILESLNEVSEDITKEMIKKIADINIKPSDIGKIVKAINPEQKEEL